MDWLRLFVFGRGRFPSDRLLLQPDQGLQSLYQQKPGQIRTFPFVSSGCLSGAAATTEAAHLDDHHTLSTTLRKADGACRSGTADRALARVLPQWLGQAGESCAVLPSGRVLDKKALCLRENKRGYISKHCS